MNQRIGYARVSTDDQNLDLQRDALTGAGCSTVYEETASGKTAGRPELEQCRKALRAGDTLVVWRLDRLGRSLPDLVRIVGELEQQGIGFESVTEKIETGSAAGKLVFHVFAALAEFERNLSPGDHSELIRAIIESFAPRFAPGSTLVYAGDTGDKWGYFDAPLLAGLGVDVDSHGKMPDVVLHFTERNWLLLVESVTSHGPVDGKRHAELTRLFAGSKAGLVYVTAFPNRAVMGRYLGEIAWETEVWVADAPSHLIHFNGSRFLGPYSEKSAK